MTGPHIPDIVKKMVSKRKKKRAPISDKHEEEKLVTQEAGSGEKIESSGPSSNPSNPSTSPASSHPSTPRNAQHSGDKTVDETSVPKKKSATKKINGSKEKDVRYWNAYDIYNIR